MKTETQIHKRLTACTIEIRKLDHKANRSSEEEDDLGALLSESATLKWVLL